MIINKIFLKSIRNFSNSFSKHQTKEIKKIFSDQKVNLYGKKYKFYDFITVKKDNKTHIKNVFETILNLAEWKILKKKILNKDIDFFYNDKDLINLVKKNIFDFIYHNWINFLTLVINIPEKELNKFKNSKKIDLEILDKISDKCYFYSRFILSEVNEDDSLILKDITITDETILQINENIKKFVNKNLSSKDSLDIYLSKQEELDRKVSKIFEMRLKTIFKDKIQIFLDNKDEVNDLQIWSYTKDKTAFNEVEIHDIEKDIKTIDTQIQKNKETIDSISSSILRSKTFADLRHKSIRYLQESIQIHKDKIRIANNVIDNNQKEILDSQSMIQDYETKIINDQIAIQKYNDGIAEKTKLLDAENKNLQELINKKDSLKNQKDFFNKKIDELKINENNEITEEDFNIKKKY